MIIYNVEQKSPEWHELRRGVLTASKFKEVITPSGAMSSNATSMMRKLALQSLDLDPHEEKKQEAVNSKFDIQWGNEHEDAARDWFMENVMSVSQVGFVKPSKDSLIGCSPDGLIPDGQELGKWYSGLEIKCPSLETHTDYLMGGVLPDDYKVQVHGSMAITGLDVWYFMSYFPGNRWLAPKYRPFVIEVKRGVFTQHVEKALAKFEDQYKIERERVYDALLWKESEVKS